MGEKKEKKLEMKCMTEVLLAEEKNADGRAFILENATIQKFGMSPHGLEDEDVEAIAQQKMGGEEWDKTVSHFSSSYPLLKLELEMQFGSSRAPLVPLPGPVVPLPVPVVPLPVLVAPPVPVVPLPVLVAPPVPVVALPVPVAPVPVVSLPVPVVPSVPVVPLPPLYHINPTPPSEPAGSEPAAELEEKAGEDEFDGGNDAFGPASELEEEANVDDGGSQAGQAGSELEEGGNVDDGGSQAGQAGGGGKGASAKKKEDKTTAKKKKKAKGNKAKTKAVSKQKKTVRK